MLPRPWDSPGKNTGVEALLRGCKMVGIFASSEDKHTIFFIFQSFQTFQLLLVKFSVEDLIMKTIQTTAIKTTEQQQKRGKS